MTKTFTHYLPTGQDALHLTDHPDACGCLPSCRLERVDSVGTGFIERWRVDHHRKSASELKSENAYHTKGAFAG